MAPHILLRQTDSLCLWLSKSHQPQPNPHHGGDPRPCCAPTPLVSSHGAFLSLRGFLDSFSGHSPLSKSIQKFSLECSCVGLAGKTGSTRRIAELGVAGQGAGTAEPAGTAGTAEPPSLSSWPCWAESPHPSTQGRAGTPGPGEGFSVLCSLPVKPLLLPFLPYPKGETSPLLALIHLPRAQPDPGGFCPLQLQELAQREKGNNRAA